MKKILKGILLYATIIYSLLFIMGIEFIVKSKIDSLIIAGLWILVLLIYGCYTAFKDDNLDNYIPKWFK